MIKTILKQVKQYKKDSILTPIFASAEVVMEILIPFLMASIIDDGIGRQNLNHICIYGGLMIVIAMFSLLFGILAGKYGASASAGLACNLRDAMYVNIQNFSFANIDKYSTPGLVTRLTTDVTNLQNAYQMILRICVRGIVTFVSAFVMAMIISPRLSLIFVVAICILGVALVIIISNATKSFNRVFRKYDDLNASVQENVSAIRVVKAYVREEYENSKFEKAAGNVYRLFVKAESVVILNNPLMMLCVYGSIIALSWFGAQMIVVGELTTGQLTSFFSYVMNIMMSLMMMSMVFVMITMSTASAERITEVLNETTDLTNPENPEYEIKDGSIDFNNVDFSYKSGSGEYVLQNINLHIKSGETIGIIGGTGSSKSSLVNLISRLYDVTNGEVLVGGRNVKEYDLNSLRDKVSVVLQKNVLFSGTILENLRWGDKDATEEECKRVCRLACADTFIEQFPDKYNTYIEQGGTNVSGGQKQRLCIARALIKKPKILILDDSTSAVDTATDSQIRESFRTEIPGTTKIIIAQRISSVQDADRIIVMDNGKINGFDTHENLLKNNIIYKEVYESQINGVGDFDRQGGAD